MMLNLSNDKYVGYYVLILNRVWALLGRVGRGFISGWGSYIYSSWEVSSIERLGRRNLTS